MEKIFDEISEIVGSGKLKQLKGLTAKVKEAVEGGIDADGILNQGILMGMDALGVRFKNGEVYLPEVMMAAKTVKECITVLKPYLSDENSGDKGKICIGTVKGDNHDIGKNIVKIMLESKGFTVFDLGTNVSAEAFVSCALENGCKIIALSALLTSTMPEMGVVVEAAKATGRDIKVIVGGAPVTEEFAKSIGADGYSSNAAECASLACEIFEN